MSSQNFVVPPRSWDSIGQVADQFRRNLGLESTPYMPVIDILEKVLDNQLNFVRFEVGDDHDMGGAEGLTDPNGEFIIIHQDVYEAAVNGDGRARFTVAHEIGHLFLHTGIPLARASNDGSIKPFRMSEPQANQFAAEFLMPRHLSLRHYSRAELCTVFGVSEEAASNRIKFLQSRGLI
ncbi:ImmA/IrrE family metallo-endopeptidase (plasmid) [Agrobacterium tumefaciens]|uniref:ImmA/IrrE family metallo-endopeptidase n=1 Tax=Agrobacterium tumefaciens TaxID=358 RepID=A0AAJ4TD30_AGRTU|nr:ImmA/IrrE family metallo-endopeptidase [Agrobacterium tumefaciens]